MSIIKTFNDSDDSNCSRRKRDRGVIYDFFPQLARYCQLSLIVVDEHMYFPSQHFSVLRSLRDYKICRLNDNRYALFDRESLRGKYFIFFIAYGSLLSPKLA